MDESEKGLTNEQRIYNLQKRVWVGYSRATEIRAALETLLKYPKTHRMPNVAIIGETNNGKTMLIENFLRKNNPPPDPNAENVTLEILMVQVPPEPDEGRLYNAMLERLWSPGSMKEPTDSKLQRLKLLLFRLETKMLVFDEFQHAIAGNATKQRRFLNAIKYLGNELQIPIVALGTPEALNALQSDPQIANRFEPMYLPKWKLDTDLFRLLFSIEPKLGLKNPSNLAARNMARLILDASEGTIGEIMKLLRVLAIYAIKSGDERITEDMLKEPKLRECGWVIPSMRNRYER